jgi:hypothetical protein
MFAPNLSDYNRRKIIDPHAAKFQKLERAAAQASPRLTIEDRTTVGKPNRKSRNQENRRGQQEQYSAAEYIHETAHHCAKLCCLP